MSHDADMPGNGHTDVDELGAMQERLSEIDMANARLLGLQERFQEQVVHDVCIAVAEVLERRLAPLESKLDQLRAVVAELTMQVQMLVRRL